MQSIEFAIANGKTKDELLKFKSLEGKDDTAIVFEDFKAKALKANTKLSEDTIQKRFNNKYNLYEFTKEESEDDYQQAKQQYDEDKEWGINGIKAKAESLRKNAFKPIKSGKRTVY